MKWFPHKKRRTVFLFMLGLVFIGLLLAWIFLPGIVNRFPLRDYACDWIEANLGGECRFESISMHHLGQFSFSRAMYRDEFQSLPFQFTLNSASVYGFLSPQFRGEDFQVKIDGKTILFTPKLHGKISSLETPYAFQLMASYGVLNLSSFPMAGRRKIEKKNKPLPLEGVVILKDWSLQLPGLPPHYKWTFRYSMDPTFSQLRIHAYQENRDRNMAAVVQMGEAFAFERATTAFHDFPASVTQPFQLDTILNATASVQQGSSAPYDAVFGGTAESLTAGGIESTTFISPSTTFGGRFSLNHGLQPQNLHANLQHGPLDFSRGADRWKVPAGRLAISSATDALWPMRMHWHFPSVGAIHIQSPTADFSQLETGLDVESTSIATMASIFPDRFRTLVEGFGGVATVRGKVAWDNFQPARIEGDLRFTEASARFGPVTISRATLAGTISGSSSSLSVALKGMANLRLGLEEQVWMELAAEDVSIHLDWVEEGNRTLVTYHAAHAGPFTEVSGQWQSEGNRWSVKGKLPIADNLAKLLDSLGKEPIEGLEGMGGMEIAVEGDGSAGQVRILSDDLTVYNFTVEPSYGLQLRDLIARANWDSAQETFLGSIQAATPYFSYASNTIEWPGDAVVVSATAQDSFQSMAMAIRPPGGGKIEMENVLNASAAFSLNRLDLNHFVGPLFTRFVLETNEEEETGWAMEGKLDGHGRMDLFNETQSGSAVLTLHNRVFIKEQKPSIRVKDATLTVPIAYPFVYDNLLKHSVSFAGESVAIDGKALEQPHFTIPITAEEIQLATHAVLPLYGGVIYLDRFVVNRWQSTNPDLAGRVRLQKLDLSALSKSLPFLPDVGELSGELSDFAVSETVVQVTGNIQIKAFGGSMNARNLRINNPRSDSPIMGADVDLETIDLESLTEYFDFGEMTGRISGRMHALRFMIDSAGADAPIFPIRFDIEIHSEMEEDGSISREALSHIVDLGQTSGFAKSMINRDRYRFSKLGLRAQLDGDRLRLYGTGEENNFLSPSKSLFSNKIAIALGNPNQVISFSSFWERLLAQIGRFKKGGKGPQVKFD
ncbi:hypothetical protein GF373_00825 [bacterium]|nr:hypothetical protein [bacterium]